MTRRKRYSAEFKREALRRANEEGVTDTLVADKLRSTDCPYPRKNGSDAILWVAIRRAYIARIVE